MQGTEARPGDMGSWRVDSECRKHPTAWWFAGSHHETMLAKRVCAGCGVQGPCLEFALGRSDLLGIWAATTPSERAEMRHAPCNGVRQVKAREQATVPVDIDLELEFEAEHDSERAPQPDPEREPEPEPEPAPESDRESRREQGHRRADGFGDRDKLLTPAEAARLLGVTPNTVTRWSHAGKISAIQTMGGHRRFWRLEVERVLRDANPLASA
jgi:excisionase family DNA binding protein